MRRKRIVSLLTSICVSFGAMLGFTACDRNTENSDGSDSANLPSAVLPTEGKEAHYVNNSLHNVKVNYDNSVGAYVKNGQVEYKIVADGSDTMVAAGFIQRKTLEAVKLKIEETSDGEAGGKYVFLGKTDKFAGCGFKMPEYSVLGEAGYVIKTYKASVFIQAYTAQGYQMGAIAFLRYVLGYDALSAEMYVYTKSGDVIPEMDILEVPDYTYRVASNKMTSTQQYDMGFSTGTLLIDTGYGNVHNLRDFTTAQEKAEHPAWFSDGANLDEGKGQPCFTAHGLTDEYEKMVNAYAAATIRFMKARPNVNNIRISQTDVAAGHNEVTHCTCSACDVAYSYYGNTIAGAMLTFTNDIADRVNEYLASSQAIADGFSVNKEFNIVLLAYGTAVKAPVVRNSNGDIVYDKEGKGQPDDFYRFIKGEDGKITKVLQKNEDGTNEKLVCHKRVSVEYAASAANYLHSYYEAENQTYANAVRAWAGLGGKIHVWLYEVNYWNYFYPYNSYDSIPETLRFFKSYNTDYVYSEGTFENAANSGFTKLRDYLASKFEFNCNYNYGEIVDFWFKNYFAEAEPYMRQYFNEIQANLRSKEYKTGGGVHSYGIASEDIWPQGMLNHWLDLFDKAYKAIEPYKATNPEKYEILYKNILIESQFPRLVLCTTYASTYSEKQLKSLRSSFYKDFNELQNTHLREGELAEDTVFKSWDLD